MNAVSDQVTLADVQGVWKRSYLKAPGQHDTDTLVFWFQAGRVHVDLRLPANYQAISDSSLTGCLCLADLEADQLRALTLAEGFAGITGIVDNTCVWTRLINYRGCLNGEDTGVLKFVEQGLLETGIHDDYSELWTRVDPDVSGGAPLSNNSWIMTSQDGSQSLMLVCVGGHFALARGRSADLNLPQNLQARMDVALSSDDQDSLSALLDMEFCVGRIVQGQGVIEHSTNPFRSGTLAFTDIGSVLSGSRLQVNTVDFYGKVSSVICHIND